jgi:hypothetical protein
MWSTATTAAAVCKFCIGAADDEDVLRGVVVVGRPVARMLDDALTLEVTRTATDGTRNACSLLYAAAWRAAKALGYQRLVTRTQRGETGASLPAAGGRSSRTGRRMPGGTGVPPPPGARRRGHPAGAVGDPVKPPVAYYGGNTTITGQIVTLLPVTPHCPGTGTTLSRLTKRTGFR